MNKGGIDEWLKQAPPEKQQLILTLARRVQHNCLTCWWLQFGEGKPNRGCKYEQFNKEKLPFKMIPEKLTWVCKGWRVDPDALNRCGGIAGFTQ